MTQTFETLKSRIQARAGSDTAKGEVWLGRALFEDDHHDTPDNHLRLADRLGHALVCLPVMGAQTLKPDLGYTYFSPAGLAQAAAHWDGPVFGVIDGPLQEMVNTLGLVKVLTQWIQDPQSIKHQYQNFAREIFDLAARISDLPITGIIITDDLAGETGPFINPDDIDALCTPFYSSLVPTLQKKQKAVLFHSCGKLDALIPMIQSWHPDGFAAIQSRINAFDTLFNDFDSRIVILGGIEADHLGSTGMPSETVSFLQKILLSPDKTPLVLGTSCGLFQADFLDKIKAIYQRVTLQDESGS